MKKLVLLSAILTSMYSDSKAMTKALAETAKIVEKKINAGQSISKVNIDFLTSVPQAMRAISTETEIKLCMEATKKYTDGNWKDKSIEELLSRVDFRTPLKSDNLIEDDDLYGGSVGAKFSQWRLCGYCLGKGSLYKSSLNNALNVVSSFDFRTGANIRDIADNIYSIPETIRNNVGVGSETSVSTENLTIKHSKIAYRDGPYVTVDQVSTDNAEEAIKAAAQAAVETVVFNADANNDEFCMKMLQAATLSLTENIPNLDSVIVDAVAEVIKEKILEAMSSSDVAAGFNDIRTTEYITNVHRLHLMGAMQAIMEGKGIPCGDLQASAAKNVGKKLIDDLTPDIPFGEDENRIAPWDYGTGTTDAQKRLAAQNFLKIARTLE